MKDTGKADWPGWMFAEDVLLVYVTGDTRDSFPLRQGGEQIQIVKVVMSWGGIRLRSKCKAAAGPQCKAMGLGAIRLWMSYGQLG